jgi:plasmid stabilization system protein ParE
LDKVNKPVLWTTRATKDLQRTVKFYIELYGKEKAREIATEIRQRTKTLERTHIDITKSGSIDESFSHLKHTYRKLNHQHCKITYRVGRSKIYIIRVFDTRQNPKKNL